MITLLFLVLISINASIALKTPYRLSRFVNIAAAVINAGLLVKHWLR